MDKDDMFAAIIWDVTPPLPVLFSSFQLRKGSLLPGQSPLISAQPFKVRTLYFMSLSRSFYCYDLRVGDVKIVIITGSSLGGL